MLQPHIQLDETVNTRYAILPGDPGRLDRIALQLEDVRELAFNREFRSLKGNYKGSPSWPSPPASAAPPPPSPWRS